MINEFLQKYLKKQPNKLMLVMGALLFTLQTTPVYCGACLIRECRHTTSIYASSGDVVSDATMQTKKCCASESGTGLKSPEFVTESCPSCNCMLTEAIEDQTKVTLTSSVPLRILFVPGFPDSVYDSFNLSSHPRLVLSQLRARSNPIFVINSAYLI
jgi:hypothetical protein